MYVQYIWILERRLPREDLDPISAFTSVTDILFFATINYDSGMAIY